MQDLFQEFLRNFTHNLFKPLLLFFYMGFLIPIFKVQLDFPKALYQGLTLFLLVSIGWKGGEELADLKPGELAIAGGFMGVGVVANTLIGITAFLFLRAFTRLRRVDAATVAGYYGSDSAGTFVTAVGALATAHLAAEAYMPVMLAVMEIPGCLVALFLVARLRSQGMDPAGNMPDEPGYDLDAEPVPEHSDVEVHDPQGVGHALHAARKTGDLAHDPAAAPHKPGSPLTAKMLHEVFLNPGIYLLIAGIAIGFISRKQGKAVTEVDDKLFLDLFQGMLCLFLLEMGMTASSKLRDLRTAGWPFIAYGLIAPNIYATMGIFIAHGYSTLVHHRFGTGTYVLFAVLCGAASYIAVPAVQRLAIPEASPTLPLAASLGLTFSYNVTIGIPVYILIAQAVAKYFPIG